MDLAKVEPSGRARPRRTTEREATMPRVSVAQPAREINAVIRRPDMRDAQELAHLLGLAADVAGNIASDVQSNRNEQDAAAAALDFAADKRDDPRFAKSRAYRDAWQNEGTKALALRVSNEAHEAVTARLSDPDNPATLDEVDATLEAVFRKHVFDERGQLLDFGTPEAKATLARSFAEVRAGLLPQAQAAIKAQTDEAFLSTWATNTAHEFRRGAAIGVNRSADPLAPLPETVAGDAVRLPAEPFHLEAALARVPPGVDKGAAKKFLLTSLFNEARERGTTELLDGLENSERKDGAPSWTPYEVALIVGTREKLAEDLRKRSEKAKERLWEDNHNRVMLAFESDNPPTVTWLRDAAHRGLIDPDFAFTMENHIETETRVAAAEARRDAREAASDARSERAIMVGGLLAQRQSGDLAGASPAEDLQLFRSGRLGSGPEAVSNYRQLRAAARLGEAENLKNPDVARYAGALRQQYGTQPTNILSKSLQGGGVNFVGMIGLYRRRVADGAAPAEAYAEAILKFAPKSAGAADARRSRIEQLRAKQQTP